MDGARERFAAAAQWMVVDAGFPPRLLARDRLRDPRQSIALLVLVWSRWLWAEESKTLETDHRLPMDTLHDHDRFATRTRGDT